MKEVIVVEGKNDYHAVKRAFPDAEIITTSGYGLNSKIIERIRVAQKNKGVIIFTDPDHMGEVIRKKIQSEVPGAKHCYIPRDSAIHKGDIGIENASADTIKKALNKAMTVNDKEETIFSQDDLIKNQLVLSANAQKRRERLGDILGIGYANAKTFLRRLNIFGITREEFLDALRKIGDDK